MFITFKRLLTNPTFMFNNLASMFYIFGYNPYFTYLPKYFEVQYRLTASMARCYLKRKYLLNPNNIVYFLVI